MATNQTPEILQVIGWIHNETKTGSLAARVMQDNSIEISVSEHEPTYKSTTIRYTPRQARDAMHLIQSALYVTEHGAVYQSDEEL